MLKKKDPALKEILEFQDKPTPGVMSLLIASASAVIIGGTFAIDKIAQTHIRSEVYAGAIAFAGALAIAGEAALYFILRERTVDRTTFYNLYLTELPPEGFECCFFHGCTFDLDLSELLIENCTFINCKFKSRIDRSTENCDFWNCSLAEATVDPGFFFRHRIMGVIGQQPKVEYLYPRCFLDTNYPFDGWIGNFNCLHNARSRHLRCAINPKGLCKECPDFEPPPIVNDVKSLILDLPRRMGNQNLLPTAQKLVSGVGLKDLLSDAFYDDCVEFGEYLEGDLKDLKSEAFDFIEKIMSLHDMQVLEDVVPTVDKIPRL